METNWKLKAIRKGIEVFGSKDKFKQWLCSYDRFKILKDDPQHVFEYLLPFKPMSLV